MGLGSAKDEAKKVYKRNERIVSRRVHNGLSPAWGAGHEILQRCAGHRSERGRQPPKKYHATGGSESEALQTAYIDLYWVHIGWFCSEVKCLGSECPHVRLLYGTVGFTSCDTARALLE